MPLAARVVEVLADLGEGHSPRYRTGSGCIVAGRTVLTAAHVVEGAVSVKVRPPDKVIHEAALDTGFVGDVDGPGPDLALVELTGSGVDVPAMGLAAVDRDSVSGDPVERALVGRRRGARRSGSFSGGPQPERRMRLSPHTALR